MSQGQALADVWFKRLEELLKDRKLPCENGPARVCSPDEFMFMQESAGQGQFKHRDTRNYVMVRKLTGVPGPFDAPSPNGYELFVPFTMTAFQRGFFDSF